MIGDCTLRETCILWMLGFIYSVTFLFILIFPSTMPRSLKVCLGQASCHIGFHHVNKSSVFQIIKFMSHDQEKGYAAPVAHLAWKKGVCQGRAAFDITFQHKTTFSFNTRNLPMNFAMLPKYHIGKILPIYSISAIFAHKSRYTSFLHRVFRNLSCYFVSD